MGYYSDVGIIFTDKGKEEFFDILKHEYTKHEYELVNNFLNSVEIHEYDKHTMYLIGSIKWYTTDKDYREEYIINEIIEDYMDSEDYFYIVSGEEPDDISCKGNYHANRFDLGVKKTLTYWNYKTGESEYLCQ